jgi:hypothetical protein
MVVMMVMYNLVASSLDDVGWEGSLPASGSKNEWEDCNSALLVLSSIEEIKN